MKVKEPILRDPSMNRFAVEIGRKRFNPISIQVETELIKRAQNGDVKAAQRIIESNIRYAFKFSKEFTGQNLKQSDALAAAVLGMCEAVARFDVSKGCKFYSYAVWWMRRYCMDALRESLLIHIPSGVVANNKKLSTIEGIENLDLTPREAKKLNKNLADKHKSSIINHTYTEVKNDEGNSISILETISSDEAFEKYGESNESDFLKASLMNLLTDREYLIVCQKFGLFDTEPSFLSESDNRILKIAIQKLQQNKHLLKYFL